MLNITKKSKDRLDIELSGMLNSAEMGAGLEALLHQSEGITNGRMLYTITNFEMPSMGALSVELQYMPALMRLVGTFDKCAVVCDVAWIRTAAEFEGMLMPGLEIKAFPTASRAAAEDWLEEGASAETEDETGENFPV